MGHLSASLLSYTPFRGCSFVAPPISTPKSSRVTCVSFFNSLLAHMAVKLAVARKAGITVFATRRARLQMRCLRPAILRIQSSAPSLQSEETKMTHNHPPPWMNSNTRLGAYLPLPTTKTSPSSTGSKVGCRVVLFFARMRQVEQDRARREVRNVARCCCVLKLLRHPTTTSNTQKSCEPEPPFSRLAAQTQVL